MQRRIQSSTGQRGKRVAGQQMGRTSSDYKGGRLSAMGKKEAVVVRRSDVEYFSSLQTNASHIKFQQDSDAMSSHKTFEQRQRDSRADRVLLRTTLGKQNQAEQVLASGFFTHPKQQVKVRPTTAKPERKHQVVGNF